MSVAAAGTPRRNDRRGRSFVGRSSAQIPCDRQRQSLENQCPASAASQGPTRNRCLLYSVTRRPDDRYRARARTPSRPSIQVRQAVFRLRWGRLGRCGGRVQRVCCYSLSRARGLDSRHQYRDLGEPRADLPNMVAGDVGRQRFLGPEQRQISQMLLQLERDLIK